MNRTMGFAMLVTGIFYLLCGVLYLIDVDVNSFAKAMDVNAGLFLGGGVGLLVLGILLMNDVHLAPPGSLMVRRGR